MKKAVSWALRTIGGRRAALHDDVRALALELAARDGTARWIGKDVLADIERPQVRKRLGV